VKEFSFEAYSTYGDTAEYDDEDEAGEVEEEKKENAEEGKGTTREEPATQDKDEIKQSDLKDAILKLAP